MLWQIAATALLAELICNAASVSAAAPDWDYRAESLTINNVRVHGDLPADQAARYTEFFANYIHLLDRRMGPRGAGRGAGRGADRGDGLMPRIPARYDLFIFRDTEDYQTTMRRRFAVDVGDRVSIFFDSPDGPGLAVCVEDLSEPRIRSLLQHEGFHYYAWYRFGPDLPVWLQRGFAEVCSQAVLYRNELVYFGEADADALAFIRDLDERDAVTPLTYLVTLTESDWKALPAEDRRAMHMQSWSVVHMLLQTDAARLQQYLVLINEGVEEPRAYERVFGQPRIDRLEDEWRAWLKTASPRAFLSAWRRLEFFAEAILVVRQHDLDTESMDDVISALGAIEFTFQDRRGDGVTLSLPAREEIGDLPAERDRRQPQIEMISPRRPGSRRERELEEIAATPPSFMTRWVRPADWRLTWQRDADNPEAFHYVIQMGR